VKAPPDTAHHAGPFTVDWLRAQLQPYGRRYGFPPDWELARIASLINMVDGRCRGRAAEIASQEYAIEVHHALQVLTRFFAERERECESPDIDRQIVENERRLGGQFDSFMATLAMTPCELDLDKGRRRPPLKSWRDFAHFIAYLIKGALEDSNPGKPIGFSDDGPVVGLTMAALGVIAGDDTKLRPTSRGALGQHLRQRKRV
jgi:hypothetical protein